MAEISASAVMKLRNLSGQGMMDCKKALKDTDGDVDKALELLRKKGVATLAKRAERATSNGLVVTKEADGGKTVAMTTLCCETDFVAKGEGFAAAAQTLADYAMACSADEGIDALLATAIDGKPYSEVITELVSQTGEKTEVGHYARFKVASSGLVSTYIHFNGKVGAMILVETSDDSVAAAEGVKEIAADICMHISAIKPMALSKDDLDPEVVAKERDIYTEQVKGKPAEIIDKIVDGKINRFYADNCLLAQPFVKDDKKSVEQALSDAAKAAGGTAKLVKFVRFDIGAE